MAELETLLRDRLSKITGEYADEMSRYQEEAANLLLQHRLKIEELERERTAAQHLLDIERKRSTETERPTPPASASNKLRLPLADFLVMQVKTHGLLSREDLQEEARIAGYLSEPGAGRTFNMTLMNIEKVGRIRRGPDACYAPAITSRGLFESSTEPEEVRMARRQIM